MEILQILGASEEILCFCVKCGILTKRKSVRDRTGMSIEGIALKAVDQLSQTVNEETRNLKEILMTVRIFS
jgi:hypothetical protein